MYISIKQHSTNQNELKWLKICIWHSCTQHNNSSCNYDRLNMCYYYRKSCKLAFQTKQTISTLQKQHVVTGWPNVSDVTNTHLMNLFEHSSVFVELLIFVVEWSLCIKAWTKSATVQLVLTFDWKAFCKYVDFHGF